MKRLEILDPPALAAAQALDRLRRQLPIVFHEDNGKSLGVIPAEGLSPDGLNALQQEGAPLHLLLSATRAEYLGFTTGSPLLIDAKPLDWQGVMGLMDPLATPASSKITSRPGEPTHSVILTLAKQASLLPALLILEKEGVPESWTKVTTPQLESYWEWNLQTLRQISAAHLPIDGAENTRLLCFRAHHDGVTHLALVIGDIAANPAPLTRIHSSCVTGDILGSLRCDCGHQLRLAIDTMIAAGSGILLYLHQEGRGIGIANKLRAYQLQEQGRDTYDANHALGFEWDERDFTIAAAILKQLNVPTIQLVTNNPLKMAAIERTGIQVAGRVPVVIMPGAHNHAYLQAKAQKSGHLL